MVQMSSTEPRRYLIAIGSSQCPKMEGYNPLEHVEDDIKKIADLFAAQGYKRVLCDEIEIDDDSDQIRDAIGRWFASSDRCASDYVVIYYAGHGDEGGRFGHHYLFTFNSRENRIADTAIKARDFIESFFQGDPSRTPQNILLILDVCYAHIGGRQIAQALSDLKSSSPEGSGFWLISSANSNTEAGDGAFVEALSAVMQPDHEGFQQSGEFISIDVLVNQINQYFEATQQAQRAIADGRGFQQTAAFIRNPRCIPSDDFSFQGIQWRGKPLITQVIEHLWSLDYENQIDTFKRSIVEMPDGAIITVQAENRRLQFWLTKRLLRKLPVPIKSAYNECIFISMKEVQGSFELFCDALANGLGLEALVSQLTSQQTSQVLIKKIIEQYRTKNVVLVIQDWPQRDSLRRDAKELLVRIIREFWQPLRSEISKQGAAPLRYRLILCLMDVKGKNSNLGDLKNEVPSSASLIDLAPLNIPPKELRSWVLSNELLQELKDDSEVECFLADFSTPESLENSEAVINEICDLCGLKGGIIDIEEEWERAEWRLAG